MNIVIIMSGGVGRRFGSIIPKQYNLINGKPVIDYVVEAVRKSKKTDKVVVVIDEQWIEYSECLKNSGFDFVPNGETRTESMKNGLDYINRHYACQKVVIVDAVRPFLYADLIDEYFDKLEEYDAVITAEKITGGFTDIHDSLLDREDYIITNSPEGFKFSLLYNNYDVNFPYQETAGMLPKGSKRYYNYNFKNNLKLTYDFELKYAELMLQALGYTNQDSNVAFFDKNILLTDGIRKNLLRTREMETLQWIDKVYRDLPELIKQWEITSFLPNQISRYGLILEANSQKYGEVVLKFIPSFIHRYERELETLQKLSSKYICDLLAYEEDKYVMLLRKVKRAKYACFEENKKLTEFFKDILNSAELYKDASQVTRIPLYQDRLEWRKENVQNLRYCKEEIREELTSACALYREVFQEEAQYILHMDLHNFNILDDGEVFIGIDPIGMVAPKEFELVRFIRNDVREHEAFGYEERFDLLIHSFGRFADKRKLAAAFIIDMAFCAYNSVFENETPEETLVNLELIRIAKQYREIV